jgi:antirestriction protein
MRPGQFGGPALEASKYNNAVMYAPSMASTRIPILALSKGAATMLEDKAPTMRAARANPKTTPRIYVANLAAYNSGRLKGKWIEPSTDADELAEQIADAIGGNVDRDEWAFHDYDAFPDMGENPDLDDVAAMVELLEEHPYAIVKAAMSFVWNNDRQDIDSLKEWLDDGYGIYESKRDYVEQLVDDMGGPSKLGKQAIDSCFDYDAFGHDLSIDADEEDRERYEGMSDEEIGMQHMDDVYGDKIPADLADRYFDYDAYARDVFMEVASVRTPEGLVVFNAR